LKKDIKSLKDLQAIDLEVKKIDDEIAEGNADLDRRKISIEKLTATIAGLKEKLDSMETRKRELEVEIDDQLARIKDRQTKLMNVQTNREYQSILKEIEDTKKANRGREDELVLLMERSENVQKNLGEQTNVRDAEETLLNEEIQKVKKDGAALHAKKEGITKKREEKAQKVSVGGLKKYEKLRANRNGLAVVGVTNGVCRGCNMNIPPQQFNNLLKNEELLTCPTCNRMLFHQHETLEK
jgi:hypothetical protein